jgi:hypothetical protein
LETIVETVEAAAQSPALTGDEPKNVSGPHGLNSSASRVALTSSSDFVVGGSEQVSSLSSTMDIYRFRGTDGSFVWKFAGEWSLTLIGLDSSDQAYAIASS